MFFNKNKQQKYEERNYKYYRYYFDIENMDGTSILENNTTFITQDNFGDMCKYLGTNGVYEVNKKEYMSPYNIKKITYKSEDEVIVHIENMHSVPNTIEDAELKLYEIVSDSGVN